MMSWLMNFWTQPPGSHSLITLEDQLRTNAETTNDYATQVSLLSDMFEGISDYGNQQTRSLIKIRSAFTVGSGVKGVAEKETHKKFISKFLHHNDLDRDGALPQKLAAEAEIEGKILVRLVPNPEEKMIEIRFISWSQHGYVVETQENDYGKYSRVTYNINKTGKAVTLSPEEFVFVPFGGRTHKVNETPPALGGIIREIRGLDKAIRDWRRINWIHASPTPWFNCETSSAVSKINDLIHGSGSSAKWKIGRAIITSGVSDFKLVSADMSGTESLEREIKMAAGVISGATGIPIHFLGLPESISNSTVADSLMEMVTISTAADRRIWVNFYTQLLVKAIKMAKSSFSEHANLPENTEDVRAEIPYVNTSKLKEIVDVWLPLYNNNAITLETLLSKIPDIHDVEEEAQLIQDRDKELRPTPPSIYGQKNNLPQEAKSEGQRGGDISAGKRPPERD